jgi:glycosyltransferase involved in cell wall biosynthesis
VDVTDVAAQPFFSIVLCTRNPRSDYLQKVLSALSRLTGRITRELVVVDSNSAPPLEYRGIGWPEGTRVTRLEKAGVARARATGVREAKGKWILFVDDDNVLDADYLERAVEIIERDSSMVLFCGRITGAFESPPPDWLSNYYQQLAIIDFPEDSVAAAWIPDKIPCWTAGMCVRRDIVMDYCEHLAKDPFAQATISTRVEDVYLVMRTVAKGHKAGLFRALHLHHLIPAERMTVDYLCAISRETAFNMTVLRCREQGVGPRDLLRPLWKAVRASLRSGRDRDGRIACAAATADLRGALACMWMQWHGEG